MENYSEIVQELISSYNAMGYNTSFKLYFVCFHLDFFPDNMGAVSDEHGERFHQEISQPKRYSGKWSPNMHADYCWSLVRETPTGEYKKQKSECLMNFFVVRIPYTKTCLLFDTYIVIKN